MRPFGSINASKSLPSSSCLYHYSSAIRNGFFRDVKCIDLDQIFGFILNVPSDYKLGFVVLPFRRRHWIAIRRIDGIFWNLDSKLNAPERIGADHALLSYLNIYLQSNDKELFIIVSAETEKTKRWLRSEQWPVDDSNIFDFPLLNEEMRRISMKSKSILNTGAGIFNISMFSFIIFFCFFFFFFCIPVVINEYV